MFLVIVFLTMNLFRSSDIFRFRAVLQPKKMSRIPNGFFLNIKKKKTANKCWHIGYISGLH